jgi:hypothetical protein
MGLRRYLARIFRFDSGPAATGLQLVYEDAVDLARRAYAGRSISRRDMQGRMSQPRWTRARALLKLAGVLDSYGRLDMENAYSFDEAERRVRAKANEIERHSRRPNYVSPV